MWGRKLSFMWEKDSQNALLQLASPCDGPDSIVTAFHYGSHPGESSGYSVFILFSMETSFLQSCFSLLLTGTDNSNISYSAALFRIVDMGTVSLHTSALLRSSFDLLRIYKLRYPFSNTITTKCRDLQ